MDLAAHIASRVAALLPADAPVCVGFSGGLDSTVLLDILAAQARAAGRALTAVHVHHGLSPHADAWSKFCTAFCEARTIPLAIEHVEVDSASPEGLEGAARIARYAVFAARPEPFIALAHHLDDQAETVLLQLLRGTGLKGIAAMAELRPVRGIGPRIFRPLLGIPRAELAQYARTAGLEWIEDESNASLEHDRNFLRLEVAPPLDGRFPGWRGAAHRFARHAASAQGLLEELARIDGAPDEAGEVLPVEGALSAERRANVLRAFLGVNGVAMPSEARLAEMARQLYEARPDARIRIDHDGIFLARHRDAVHIERNIAQDGAWRVEWHGESEVQLGEGRGSVHFDAATGEGLARAALESGEFCFMPRSGGERLRLEDARHSRTLKNLLQEHALPAWDRERLPLLFDDGRLVWVPGIGIAAEYACGAGDPGLRPCWRVAGKPPVC